MRALTGSEVLVANKLFATLDTTVRALHPETIPRVLMTDTVGFIKNLPHDLVASFKSTLEEAVESSLLLHVIDASDPGFERQLEVTDTVLAEIGASEVPRIRIFNKIDGVGDASEEAACKARLEEKYPNCIVMAAYRADDIVKLHRAIATFFQQGLVEGELFLPWTMQQLRGKIFSECEVVEESADDDGARFKVRGNAESIKALRIQLGMDPPPAKVDEW
jgi:GTPase